VNSAGPPKSILLQLTLPGASRFLGLVSERGCEELGDRVGSPVLILTWDGLDRRFSQSGRFRAADIARLFEEENPGVEGRYLRKPGDDRIAWVRAADDLPDDLPACPLALALDLLFPGIAGDRSVVVLELGPPGRPVLLFMAGRDEDGNVDASTLQTWIHPQDATAHIAREFALRGAFTFDETAPVRGHEDLLHLAGGLPTYPQARLYFGRPLEEWAGLASRSLLLLLLLSLASGAFAMRQLQQLRAQEKRANQDIVASRTRVDLALASFPRRLAQAASVDVISLVAAARVVWRPGAVVQARAHGDERTLSVRWKVPHGEGDGAIGGASAAAPVEAGRAPAASRFADELSGAWSGEVPAGFARSQAILTGDGNEVAIAFQSRSTGRRAALRALD
jgi:hypothetical protein